MTNENTATLRVRNIEQAALYELELKGQLSDGHWENSRPYDHWKIPANVTVIVDPVNQGRNFYPKRTYTFASRELLSVVGERMIVYVKLTRAFGMKTAKILGDYTFRFVEYNGNPYEGYMYAGPADYLNNLNNEYYTNIKKVIASVSREQILAALDVPYTRKDLLADLKDLTTTFNTQYFEAVA